MCFQVRAVFVFVQKEGKNELKKAESLVTRISETDDMIYFKF